MSEYQIITDATADLNSEMLTGLPFVEIIPMDVEIDGHIYTYGPQGNISAYDFYKMQKEGKFATTSQINPAVYFKYFDFYLNKGKDILYLCFSSGMSGTMQSARLCIEELKEKYPERNIVCIDTLCASIGEGFIVREASCKKKEGLSLQELTKWVMDYRLKVCHWFTVDVFEHLRHGGRVSAATAFVGTTLHVKPLLHVDDHGQLSVVGKPRGHKRAINALFLQLVNGWDAELGNCIVIGHASYLEGAIQLKEKIAERFPNAEIIISEIGPIIGAHTGPGMLALIYWGNNR